MTTDGRRTVPLGELVVAAFDVAARQSEDPREISRLATRTVRHLLRCASSGPGCKEIQHGTNTYNS
jgi:hypothetical protein